MTEKGDPRDDPDSTSSAPATQSNNGPKSDEDRGDGASKAVDTMQESSEPDDKGADTNEPHWHIQHTYSPDPRVRKPRRTPTVAPLAAGAFLGLLLIGALVAIMLLPDYLVG